jgi:hypothetical protein
MFFMFNRRVADLADHVVAQLIGVTAADHDVFELGPGLDVFEGLGPAVAVGLEAHFFDAVSVTADGVGARTEAAIHRAGVQGQEQGLVAVAVREAGHGRVGLLAEAVEPELRVVGQDARAHGDELDAQRIRERRAPVDEAEQVGADADVHRRLLEARPASAMKLGGTRPCTAARSLSTRVMVFLACHLWSRNVGSSISA